MPAHPAQAAGAHNTAPPVRHTALRFLRQHRTAPAAIRVRDQEGPMSVDDTPWDYIIVGAGTAGCLMANRLSADRRYRVLLVEAGGDDDYHWIHIPVGYLYCIGNPRTDWLYSTEPTRA
jgi:hypothetical protein